MFKHKYRDALNIRFIGSVRSGYFTVIVFVVIATYMIYGKMLAFDGEKEMCMNNELNKIEYADTLVYKETLKKFDGKEMTVVKSNWFKVIGSNYKRSFLGGSILEKINTSNLAKDDVIKIYFNELEKNSWVPLYEQNTFRKDDLKFIITFLAVNDKRLEGKKSEGISWMIQIIEE